MNLRWFLSSQCKKKRQIRCGLKKPRMEKSCQILEEVQLVKMFGVKGCSE